MKRTDATTAPPSPAPQTEPARQIGTDAEQTIHRPPAPSPAEAVADFRARRPDDVVWGC